MDWQEEEHHADRQKGRETISGEQWNLITKAEKKKDQINFYLGLMDHLYVLLGSMDQFYF